MKVSNDQELVCGINAVKEIISIRPRSVLSLFLQDEKQSSRIESLSNLANKNHIEKILEDDKFFEHNFSDQNHQGVAILCNKRLEENETFLEKLLEKENLLILILDHLTDPHNVGACLRSAAAAGADAVIVPKNRSCHLTPTVRKISSGGSELMPFIVVTNLNRTIERISDSGIKVIGAAADTGQNHTEIDMKGSAAFIIGSEDKGLKRLTAEKCDTLAAIDMPGGIESLNASVTAGIILFEYVRQNNHPKTY
jgi:23S rRNA (guanosine2251-2'-O)-methyltransferase